MERKHGEEQAPKRPQKTGTGIRRAVRLPRKLIRKFRRTDYAIFRKRDERNFKSGYSNI